MGTDRNQRLWPQCVPPPATPQRGVRKPRPAPQLSLSTSFFTLHDSQHPPVTPQFRLSTSLFTLHVRQECLPPRYRSRLQPEKMNTKRPTLTSSPQRGVRKQRATPQLPHSTSFFALHLPQKRLPVPDRGVQKSIWSVKDDVECGRLLSTSSFTLHVAAGCAARPRSGAAGCVSSHLGDRLRAALQSGAGRTGPWLCARQRFMFRPDASIKHGTHIAQGEGHRGPDPQAFQEGRGVAEPLCRP